MVSTEDLFQTCSEKGLRAHLSADEYARVWKAFNLVMLKQIKSRRSVYYKDLFTCRCDDFVQCLQLDPLIVCAEPLNHFAYSMKRMKEARDISMGH